MAKRDNNNADPAHLTTTEVATDATSTASAAGKSVPAAATAPTPEEIKAKRFTIKRTEKGDQVKAFAGVVIDGDGIGHCDNPGTAYHCVLQGYEVRDTQNNNELYTGTKPKDAPANA